MTRSVFLSGWTVICTRSRFSNPNSCGVSVSLVLLSACIRTLGADTHPLDVYC